MKISPVSYNINFSSSSRTIKLKDIEDTNLNEKIPDSQAFKRSGLVRSNFTTFFRDDLNGVGYSFDNNWIWFRKFICNFFKDVNKVNVYSIGCSDGSEAYSFIISMIEETGEKEAQKFFPILAFDNDKEIIKTAKQNTIKATKHDIEKIDINTSGHADKYYSIIKTEDKQFKYILKRQQILKDKVNFEVGDFPSIINKIKKSNSLVLCKNIWPYLDENIIDDTIYNLSKTLDKTSLLIIGGYDNEILLGSRLEQYGFKKRTKNIFQNT